MPVLPDDQGEKMMEVAEEKKYIYICIKKRKKKDIFYNNFLFK
jgi:hypothetical protein